jgi:hypothetical protein
VSPVAGIGLTAAPGTTREYRLIIQAAAITPALLFGFVFNSLLIAVRRQVFKVFSQEAAIEMPLPTAPPTLDRREAVSRGPGEDLAAVQGITGGVD